MICQLPESPYAVPDVTGNTRPGAGIHGLLEFLADGHCSTALKERKEHKRTFPAHWIVEALPPKPAFTDSRGNRHRHLRYLGSLRAIVGAGLRVGMVRH